MAVDDAANADELAGAAVAAGSEIDVLVEIDVGLHRAGVREHRGRCRRSAPTSPASPGLRLAGCSATRATACSEPDRALPHREGAGRQRRADRRGATRSPTRGLSTEIVAGGGLGTWDITGANPRITEIHAGSYIFTDAFHTKLVPGFEVALTVLSTVISRSGDTAVLDCGRKAIGFDRALPEVVGGRGAVRYEHGEYFIHEEHMVLDLPDDSARPGRRPDRARAQATPPTTVNHYDIYYVVDDDRVVDVWPILGRYGSESAGVGPPPAD